MEESCAMFNCPINAVLDAPQLQCRQAATPSIHNHAIQKVCSCFARGQDDANSIDDEPQPDTIQRARLNVPARCLKDQSGQRHDGLTLASDKRCFSNLVVPIGQDPNRGWVARRQ